MRPVPVGRLTGYGSIVGIACRAMVGREDCLDDLFADWRRERGLGARATFSNAVHSRRRLAAYFLFP